ncbi:bifunctional folylpolyglutamate synthase/dihydrofolate synthase [Planococcus sp. YIM B11945]|uniref:bifunctional folylpolyglutamate synthase/dihydrofolate synthase n=1 Tax=Planococcus sp. YIM B11945 TaxID=3435410 RepID=UPI003D7D6897
MINGLDSYKAKWNIQTDASIKPGLDAITAALEELGDPHKKGQFVHLAGTNGKGSTAAMLKSILREHGLSVGNFYSPAIFDIHDQIQLNGTPVTPQQLDEAMKQLANLQTPLTDFELLTAAAFLVFNKFAPDVAIIEAGMGGRFDSTNVIDPIISIIPSISYDHTNFLGETIEDITWHKAGIIKKWKPVIIGDLPAEARDIIHATADELHAEVIEARQRINAVLKLKGKHQLQNAGLAIEAAQELLQLEYNAQKAEKGLEKAAIPNRFEEVFPNVIFDGAHNEASIDALAAAIKEEYPNRSIHIIMGVLKDKNYVQILRRFEEVSGRFTFVDFPFERALPAESLFSESKSKIKTIRTLYDILPVQDENEVTIVTGSLYLLTAIRNSNYKLFQNYSTASKEL